VSQPDRPSHRRRRALAVRDPARSAVLGDELEPVLGDRDHVEHRPVVVVVGDLDQLVLVVLGDDGASGPSGPSAGRVGPVGLLDGLGELDVVVLVDRLLDGCGHGPSSLGLGEGGHKSRRIARCADDPDGPDGDDAVGLRADPPDLHVNDVVTPNASVARGTSSPTARSVGSVLGSSVMGLPAGGRQPTDHPG
jgi:hypothetical protein